MFTRKNSKNQTIILDGIIEDIGTSELGDVVKKSVKTLQR